MLKRICSEFVEEDFSCPVCRDFFKNPVILKCSHSVCEVCVRRFWDARGHRECPVCRKRSHESDITRNLALKNLCETFIHNNQSDSPGPELLCSLHSQKLEFFCQKDELPCCSLCRMEQHANHNVTPIVNTRTGIYNEKLSTLLEKLQEKMKKHHVITLLCEEMANHIKVVNTEAQIKEDFKKLHQFLQDEEAARIASLREEEEQKSQMMKEKIEKMSRATTSLPATIRAIQEEMEAEKITFLQNYKSTMERAQNTLEDVEIDTGALINVAKHLGNLKFRVWEKMQDIIEYTPVTLDPNTASFELILSEDLTSVGLGEDRPPLPNNPERFNFQPGVLASEGFDSGTPCWEVDVRDAMDWAVGVMEETGERKGFLSSKDRRWCVECHDGTEFSACSPTQDPAPRELRQMLQRIRVQLDWDRGFVSFSDPSTDTHLYTLTHTFTKRVFPYFQSLCEASPALRILPVKASVSIKHLG